MKRDSGLRATCAIRQITAWFLGSTAADESRACALLAHSDRLLEICVVWNQQKTETACGRADTFVEAQHRKVRHRLAADPHCQDGPPPKSEPVLRGTAGARAR
jgi:hypothetical protein